MTSRWLTFDNVSHLFPGTTTWTIRVGSEPHEPRDHCGGVRVGALCSLRRIGGVM